MTTASPITEFLSSSTEQYLDWIEKNQGSLDSRFFEELKDLYIQKLRTGDPEAEVIFARIEGFAVEGLDGRSVAFLTWIRAVNAYFHGSPKDAYFLFRDSTDLFQSTHDYPNLIRLLGNAISSATDCALFQEAQTSFVKAQAILRDEIHGPERIHLAPLYQNYALLLNHIGKHRIANEYYQLASTLADEFELEDLAVHIQANQALSMAMTGQLKKAEELFLDNLDNARGAKIGYVEARTHMHLGSVYTLLGRPAKALVNYQFAHDKFLKLDDPASAVTAELFEGELFERVGSLSQALHNYQNAQSKSQALDSLYDFADATLRVASIYRKMGLLARSGPRLRDGLEIWRKLGQLEYCGQTQIELSLLDLELGNPRKALQQLQIVQDDLDGAGSLDANSRWQLDLHMALGKIYSELSLRDLCQDAAACAESQYRLVIELATERSDNSLLRDALAGLAKHKYASNDAEAFMLFQQVARLDDTIRQELSIQELKASYQESVDGILPQMVRIALQNHQYNEALSYAWRAKGSSLLDLLYSSGSLHLSKSGDIELSTERPIDLIRQELSALRWQLVHAEANELLPSTIKETQHQITLLRQKLYELRRQQNVASQSNWDIANLQVGYIVEKMEADLLIEYMVSDNEVLAFVADKSGCIYADVVTDLETILELQEELHLCFQNFLLLPPKVQQDPQSKWQDEYLPLLSALYSALIPDLVAVKNASTILIAPSAPLHTIPFSALWTGEAFLAELHELVTTPTAALGLVPCARPSSDGQPILVGSSTGDKLLAIQGEILAIQNNLPDAVSLIDNPETLQFLSYLQQTPSILHIAAHAEVDTEAPILSFVELPNGVLTIEQIYDLPLSGTQLVTLSACNTASNMDTGGALLAFQSAFFVAGAQTVLCSLWPVDDQATGCWMAEFYDQLNRSTYPTAAIAATQRRMIQSSGHNHPAFWAAFSCNSR